MDISETVQNISGTVPTICQFPKDVRDYHHNDIDVYCSERVIIGDYDEIEKFHSRMIYLFEFKYMRKYLKPIISA